MLIGRDPEQRLVASFLEGAHQGASAALVIRGEAGIGKTAVLDDAATAWGMRTLRCTGVESEHDVPFGGLQQLFRPVRELIGRLPGPQASALRGAFGLGSERVDDRLLLGLATLNLLAEATRDGPVLCLVDDLQWIDVPSAQALLFAARRLGAEGVVMLFAVRDDPADWFDVDGVQQRTLLPLSEASSREVLKTGRSSAVNATAVERLVSEAGGNPLALLELPVDDEPDGRGTSVEAAYRARVLGLEPATRRLLLLAATAQPGEIETWTELARLADLPPMAREAAAAAGLVANVDAIVFRHPLVRSAVCGVASRPELTSAHRLVASSSADPLSRALHLAAAAEQPDEELAAELESAATAAAERAAFASAGAVYERAAGLSTESAGRVRRLIGATQAYLNAGRSELASRLVQEALPGATTIADQAALAAVRGELEVQRGTPAAAYELLVDASEAVREDPARALELRAQAIAAAFVAGPVERAFAEAHQFVESLPPTGAPYESFLRVFLAAVTAAEAGAWETAHDRLVEAGRVGANLADFRFMVWAALASAYLGDLRRALDGCRRLVASARAAGSFSALPVALLGLSRMNVSLRSFDDAEECATEGIELARQLGHHNLETAFAAILVRCLAARGRIEECRDLALPTLRQALAHGSAVAVADARLGLAELELSLGHGAAARELLEDIPHPLMSLMATPYLIEALVLTGEIERARSAFSVLTPYADTTRDPDFLGLLTRCRALIATAPDEAERLFLDAMDHHARNAFSFERARTQLAYGEFLRRRLRKTEARIQLRTALATFEGLDTPLWAERARAELAATGITARKRDPSTLDDLTPQELRVAKLVAGGASNRDVASQLFLSQKTVEYHLRKVFMKLGVSTRVELARAPLQPVA